MLTSFNNQLHLRLHMNELAPCRADIGTTVFSRQTIYLQLSAFNLRAFLWNVSLTSCPRDAGNWVSVCRTVQCDWLSVIKFNLLWRLDCKLRHHVDYQSCHGVRCSHGVRSGTDVCSCVFLVCLCYGQGLTLDSRSSTGKLIEEFGPRYHRRGISDDPALRELGIFSALGVYWPSRKGDERTSCARESFSKLLF